MPQMQCNDVMYKVKTKASQKEVETAFRSNSFGKIRNSQAAKLFLVILPRKSIVNGKQNSVYPVNVAEIMTGVPQLYHGTFNKRLPSLRFKTMVSVYPSTQKKWFDLPFRQITVDVGAVGKKIFIERFSKKSYTDTSAMYFEDTDSEDESGNSSTDDVLIDSVAEIIKGIGDMIK